MSQDRDHRPRRRWGTVAALVTAATACAAFAIGELRGPAGVLGFPLDDGWIHLQFARELARGNGLAYNPGVWVTGATSPLWAALLALLHGLPGPVVAWVKLLGAGLFLVAVDATARLGRELGLGGGASALAAGMVATSGWLVWSALSGMELPLFLALSLWGLVLHLRERRLGGPPASGAVLAVATLARPEGLLLVALALADDVVRFRREERRVMAARPNVRRLLERGALAALVLLPAATFYRAVGGHWVPSTFAAKGAPIRDLVPDGVYLRTAADVLFRSQPLLLLASLAGAAWLLSHLGTPRDRGLLPVGWLFGLPLAYSLMSSASGPAPVGNFGRYLFPLLPVVAVVGLAGLASAADRLPSLAVLGRRVPLAAFGAAILLAPQLATLPALGRLHARTVANVLESDVAAAAWLARRIDPRALVAAQDVGAIKYGLPNPILDLAGLMTPEIVPVLRAESDVYWEQRLLAFLAEARPDYLVFFAESYPMLAQAPPGFLPLTRFDVEANRAMAGSRLLILATPWNRFGDRLPAAEPEASPPRPQPPPQPGSPRRGAGPG